jgi:soluble lytic murein transglycosylase
MWFGLAVIMSLLLAGCSSTPRPVITEDLSALPAPASVNTIAVTPASNDDRTLAKAQMFDRFLRSDLSPSETFTLREQCDLNPISNIFCFSIVNYDQFEEKLKKLKLPPAKTGVASVRPRVTGGKIRNWRQLKSAPVGLLVRGLSATRPADLRRVERAALREKKCPNNIAIAIAATLEDYLPDRIEPSELAQLYERGATCLKTPADKENLLTRAGLLFFLKKQFKVASRLFNLSSSIENTYVGRALYWLYRTRLELGDEDAQRTLDLMKARYPFSFHTLVALIATKKDPGDILAKSLDISQRRSSRDPTVNHFIEQVEVLTKFGLAPAAAKVLDWAVNESQGAEPEVKIYLAQLKKDTGDYLSKIQILSEVLYKNPGLISKETMELYFPKVLFPLFEKNSSGLDPFLLLSVARQESAFNADAVSSANARGLLQIHPTTGHLYGNDTEDLMNPELNVQIGSRYLQELLTKSNGQIYLALAAYNAGANRLETWTNRYPTAEPVLFIDLIPYRETREYIASILRNYYWYRRLHQQKDKAFPKTLFDLDGINSVQPPLNTSVDGSTSVH